MIKFLFLILILLPNISFSKDISNTQIINRIESAIISIDRTRHVKDSGITISKIKKEKILDDEEEDEDSKKFDIIIIDQKVNYKIKEKEKLAYNSAKVGQYEVAIKLCKDVLKEDKNSTYAQFIMATSYHILRQYSQAKELYYQLLRSKMKNKKDIIGNILLIMIEENPEDSIYILSRLSSRNPNSAYIFAMSAIAYNSISKYNEAIILQKKAVQIEPHNIDYRYNLAILFDKAKKYNKAIVSYRNIIEIIDNSDEVKKNISINSIKKRISYIRRL